MKKIREVLRLAQHSKMSNRAIASAVGISRDAVSEYLVRAKSVGIEWPLPPEVDDYDLEAKLYPQVKSADGRKPVPNWEEVRQALRKPHATLQHQHEKYLTEHPDGLARSQFYALHAAFEKGLRSYMRQVHIGGHAAFVDFAGPTYGVLDPKVGHFEQAQIFVGVLPASNYIYAEAVWSQKLPDWIAANRRMLEFFGGAPTIIVCDNLRSGVTKANFNAPLINETYEHFAAHYSTTIVPARSRHPKDKSKVEGHVLVLERWLVLRLASRVFTSLADLNTAIRAVIDEINSRKQQKLEGCRLSAFLALDKPELAPLPTKQFQYVEIRKARVGMDKLVEVSEQRYSVPDRYVKREVEVHLGDSTVEILCGGRRIASHVRTNSTLPQYQVAHVKPAEAAYNLWTPEHAHDWARSVGASTASFVSARLEELKNEKTRGYRLLNQMRKLAANFTAGRLELACAHAKKVGLSKISHLEVVLRNRLEVETEPVAEANFEHENVRGANEYK